MTYSCVIACEGHVRNAVDKWRTGKYSNYGHNSLVSSYVKFVCQTGVCQVSTWCVCVSTGVCQVSTWCVCQTGVSGVYMVCVCVSTGCVRCLHGVCVNWCVSGVYVVCVKLVCQVSMWCVCVRQVFVYQLCQTDPDGVFTCYTGVVCYTGVSQNGWCGCVRLVCVYVKCGCTGLTRELCGRHGVSLSGLGAVSLALIWWWCRAFVCHGLVLVQCLWLWCDGSVRPLCVMVWPLSLFGPNVTGLHTIWPLCVIGCGVVCHMVWPVCAIGYHVIVFAVCHSLAFVLVWPLCGVIVWPL